MTVHYGSTGFSGFDGAVGYLSGTARNVRAFILRTARAGHGAGDKDVAIQGQGHFYFLSNVRRGW